MTTAFVHDVIDQDENNTTTDDSADPALTLDSEVPPGIRLASDVARARSRRSDGRLPSEVADADGAGGPRLATGQDVFRHRQNHGGSAPGEGGR